MRVFATVLLAVSSALAYQVTYPNSDQGWNNTGPNYLLWQRVNTDPSNFTVVLTNQNTGYDEVLDTNIDGTLGSVRCSTPSGGWPSGSNFRVNLAQDAEHQNSLLAQSSEFNIADVSSNVSTASSTMQTATTTTSSAPAATSSDTCTTPAGTNAGLLNADVQSGLVAAIAALAALFTALF